jgi:hypothetical protein
MSVLKSTPNRDLFVYSVNELALTARRYPFQPLKHSHELVGYAEMSISVSADLPGNHV